MIDLVEPACWTWDVTSDDLGAAQDCPENFGHVLLWNWQQARCAVCAVGVEDVKFLARDHDHATGLLRGLLCPSCNRLEGFTAVAGVPGYTIPHGRGGGVRSFERWRARKDVQRTIERMHRYRRANPATQLKIVVRHHVTTAPRGVILPRRYDGPLPVLDIDGKHWRKAYRASGSAGGIDRRLEVLEQLVAWYIREPGAKLPKRPDAPAQETP